MTTAELKLKMGVETTLVEKVTIEVGDSKIIVPRERIAQALLRDMFGPPKAAAIATQPKIGEVWDEQGGIYAGLMRGTEGAPDYCLILAEHPEVADVTWDKAKEWAGTLRGGEDGEFTDYTLPNRREQRLLWANLPEHFNSEWYWSSEQHASDADCAWMQGFGDGDQYDVHKGNANRARAVRRIDLTL